MISTHVGAVTTAFEALMVRSHKPQPEVDLRNKEQRKKFHGAYRLLLNQRLMEAGGSF